MSGADAFDVRARAALDDRHVTDADIRDLELARARHALAYLKGKLGNDAMRGLLHEDLETMRATVRDWVAASEGGWRSASLLLVVPGPSAVTFQDWYTDAMANARKAELRAGHPEHFVSHPLPGRVEVVEDIGETALPWQVFYRPLPEDFAYPSPWDRGYALHHGMEILDADGLRVGFSMRQSRDAADASTSTSRPTCRGQPHPSWCAATSTISRSSSTTGPARHGSRRLRERDRTLGRPTMNVAFPWEHAMPDGASDLARQLARDPEAVCRHYLPSGRRHGRYWLVGDVENAPGRSLFVRLTGPDSGKGAAGKWTDAATGEHGDLLDLIAANRHLASLRDVLDEARIFLRLPRPEPCGASTMRPHRKARQKRRGGFGPCRSRSTARSRRHICTDATSQTCGIAALFASTPASITAMKPNFLVTGSATLGRQ